MNLAWSMIALSLVGADDQKPGKPQPPGVAPLAIEVKSAPTQERWPMDLATATRIAFDYSEDFRVSRYATAVVTEFPYKTACSASRSALSEAKLSVGEPSVRH